MASVRKRTWIKGDQQQEAWVCYYRLGKERHSKTFDKKKQADAYRAKVEVEIREGIHVPESSSLTVAQAGDLWIKTTEAGELEPTTIEQYQQHLRLHIIPLIGQMKLSKLTAPAVRAFADRLRETGRSPTLTKYVVRSLGSLLSDAQERGNIIRNPVRELRRRKRKPDSKDRRGKSLVVGRDIPTPDEIKRILEAAEGKWRVFFQVAVFSGLRASELRGLRWEDVNLKSAELHVRQRADRQRRIGSPKTRAGYRTIPLLADVVRVLREWKLACPIGPLGLVFPNGAGHVEFYINIVHRAWWPLQIKAGVTSRATGDKGNVEIVAKYSGLHALRHFFASWCAKQGLSMKETQVLMGHSNISVTMDTYTHLFPSDVSVAERLGKAASTLLG
jgi:integrase